jgi:hypothetical protein
MLEAIAAAIVEDVVAEEVVKALPEIAESAMEYAKDLPKWFDKTEPQEFIKDFQDADKSIYEITQKTIESESPFSKAINGYIRNLSELNIYKGRELQEGVINDKSCLLNKEIDPSIIDENNKSNLSRMKDGLAPIGSDGKLMDLHHIGQKPDSPLGELTKTDHQENSGVLHTRDESQIDRSKFDIEKANHWKARARDFEKE